MSERELRDLLYDLTMAAITVMMDLEVLTATMNKSAATVKVLTDDLADVKVQINRALDAGVSDELERQK